MSKIIRYATGNPGKINSLQTVLEPLGYSIVQAGLNIDEIQAGSAEEVALDKARKAYAMLKEPIVVQDSAFIIPALGNFPGPYTKYILETIGVEGLTRIPKDEQTPCSFQECLVFFDGKTEKVFQTAIPGLIIKDERGPDRKYATSPLWKVFVPLNQNKTLAEMSKEEMSAWRNARETKHYGLQLAEWLASENAVDS